MLWVTNIVLVPLHLNNYFDPFDGIAAKAYLGSFFLLSNMILKYCSFLFKFSEICDKLCLKIIAIRILE